jgi:protein ImuB
VKGRPLLQAPNLCATGYGLAPGLPLSAAYALCPDLVIAERDPDRERQALERLARCALGFTPWVSLDFAPALLLEIRGSLKLFGGLEVLTNRLVERLGALGHRAECAATPSPYASVLLARQGRAAAVERTEELRSMLGDLPSAALGLDERTHERLLKPGLATLRDLWRLPREGLVRRYGTELLLRLDRAAGLLATPLREFRSPPRFDARFELPSETDHLAYFFPAIEQLLQRLSTFVHERDAGLTRLHLVLEHRDRPPTRLKQGSRRPERSAAHFGRLLHERLERLPLPAPVCAVGVSSAALVPWVAVAADLFGQRADEAADWQQLLDQLEARLGPQALKPLTLRADHRPERACGGAEQGLMAPSGLAPRPLWLLARPRSVPRDELAVIRPQPERIESGWWDAAGIRRDYHIATDRRGAKLWIYRELQNPARWYLHGLFG